jgi:hypothetical protein
MKKELLSTVEKFELERLEAVIEKSQRAAFDFCSALQQIRDGRLYRETHKTFAAYCKARWAIGKRRAFQLAKAADAPTHVLDGKGTAVPLSISARMEISKAPPEQRDRVMRTARGIQADKNKSPRKAKRSAAEMPSITAASVKEAVEQIGTEPAEQKQPTTKAEMAIAQAFQLTDLAREVVKIKNVALNIAKVDLGYELSGSRITELCDELASHLRAAAPHAPCPCGGNQEYCTYCHGRGWLTEEQESTMERGT